MSVKTARLGQREPPLPKPAPKIARRATLSTRGSALSCLLVSSDQRLRCHMERSAQSVGWSTVECESPEDSVRQAVLRDFALAVVDLGVNCQSFQQYDGLLETLRRSAGNLVVVCDRDGDENGTGELWSRQNGAWMYLPSVNDKSDLARVCREARDVAEKLRGPMKVGGTGY